MALPAMVLPFLINFGVNKAMGMSTGKALGMAGMQSMLPGSGGGLGSLATSGGEATAKQFAIEGGKTLAAGMADKKYGGAAPFAVYGGLTGLQGALGAGQTSATGIEGFKQAFTGAPQVAPATPGADSMLTKGIGEFEQIPGTSDAEILKTIKPGDTVTKAATEEAKKGLGTGELLGLGLAGTTLLGAMGGDDEADLTEKLNINYPTVKDIVTRFERKPGEQLEIGETVEERIGTDYKPRFKDGGIAQFNNGALVSKLPSKTTNDENDYSVYRRASNFVVDESGNGNGDEDTMLAQLADGEFVTTANAVLGAGIMAGANPNDASQMRDKGAKYFYEQQARFKRIFEMLKKAKAA